MLYARSNDPMPQGKEEDMGREKCGAHCGKLGRSVSHCSRAVACLPPGCKSAFHSGSLGYKTDTWSWGRGRTKQKASGSSQASRPIRGESTSLSEIATLGLSFVTKVNREAEYGSQRDLDEQLFCFLCTGGIGLRPFLEALLQVS